MSYFKKKSHTCYTLTLPCFKITVVFSALGYVTLIDLHLICQTILICINTNTLSKEFVLNIILFY